MGVKYDSNHIRNAWACIATRCKEDGTSCEGIPFPYEMFWVRYFAMKDPDWDFKTMTPQSFARTFRLATQEYTFIIYGTSDPNLSLFRDAGGKMITYHAL